jgi:hypothetical protein
MTGVSPPPNKAEMIDVGGLPTIPWALFFEGIWNGDNGTPWTPVFVGLTEVGGSATMAGKIYRIGRTLCYFTVTVTPVTNTSATAGTTYINNFPLSIKGNGACLALASNTGGNSGMVVQASQRIYVPGWTAVAVPVTVVGFCEAN